ncbi:MAG: glycosyltransferase, partial [Phycisphaerae bacterium]|nr:glycosyltransferase [Phycisphaerae bacterium]
ICYIGTVDDNTLVKEYGKARAVIFTPELEYGLVPLEACASGTPVIALGRGGVKETMIPHKNGAPQNSTAIFYEKPTAKALNEAIETFESLTFDRQKLNRHAAQFNIPNFKKQMRSIVSECI